MTIPADDDQRHTGKRIKPSGDQVEPGVFDDGCRAEFAYIALRAYCCGAELVKRDRGVIFPAALQSVDFQTDIQDFPAVEFAA